MRKILEEVAKFLMCLGVTLTFAVVFWVPIILYVYIFQ